MQKPTLVSSGQDWQAWSCAPVHPFLLSLLFLQMDWQATEYLPCGSTVQLCYPAEERCIGLSADHSAPSVARSRSPSLRAPVQRPHPGRLKASCKPESCKNEFINSSSQCSHWRGWKALSHCVGLNKLLGIIRNMKENYRNWNAARNKICNCRTSQVGQAPSVPAEHQDDTWAAGRFVNFLLTTAIILGRKENKHFWNVYISETTKASVLHYLASTKRKGVRGERENFGSHLKQRSVKTKGVHFCI